MNHLLTALPALAVMSVHVHIIWPRFIMSMVVLASMLGYLIYAWMNR